jgi:hypothetical protein
MGKPILACDDELAVTEAKRCGGNHRIVRGSIFRMPAADTLERIAFALPPLVEELARLAFGNVEMGPLRQTP